ncbi:MAG TPA: acyl-CoA synthetase FdrA [Thermoflexia bacterium]|nr:acyl-CoA synthetase FdrA [Thermoflexia bacterium]
MITRTNIKSGEYYDSVTLMEVAQGLLELEGVVDAAVVMGTPANKGILAGADLLTPEAQAAVADDLVIAVRTESDEVAEQALALAETLLEETGKVSEEGGMLSPPKTMAEALKRLDGANMVLISVAGRYAGGVAHEALTQGQHVFLFSDNVTVEDEIALKELGREKGLLVMGPDAGTAIINGVALGFANAVPAGPVGVVAASGTGLQSETSSLARMGVGITQAIGTGGRDLKTAVGGIMMLEGLKALQVDPATKVLLLVSKPPAPGVAAKVLAQLGASEKPAVVCFLGGDPKIISAAGGIPAETLEEAAYLAAALAAGQDAESSLAQLAADNAKLQVEAQKLRARLQPGQKYFRGLFSGGTFCYETQLILKELGFKVISNAPVDKKLTMADSNDSVGHVVVDLGEDEFTVGRLHPMIDPTLRNRRIIQEAEDPETAVIFLDVVLGYGVHPDPAGSAVEAIQAARALAKAAGREVLFVASVCGTPGDPQNSVEQEAKLRAAGVQVLPTNAAATRLAGYILDF